ncbi:MAG: PEP-CTERM sorting domain-containing protein [Akkermansiaceae bacterium]
MKIKKYAALMTLTGLSVSSQAAIMVTTSAIDILGTAPTVSNTDLAQTQFSSSSSTGGDAMATRHGEMFNGTIGVAGAQNTDNTDWVRNNTTNEITLNLDISSNTLGYDITGIDTIFGWSEAGGGRADQGYTIELGFVGGGTATLVNAGFWEPNAGGEFWTVVSFTNNGGGALNSDTVNLNGGGDVADANTIATGVQSITWNITNSNTPSIAAEFDVFGVATVPEPSSTALLGLGGLGLILRRRRMS